MMMKRFTILNTILVVLFFWSFVSVQAQTAVLNADDIPDNTYELINSVLANSGKNVVESPDISPGNHLGDRHIAEVFDTDLNKNVFEFYAHVASGPTGVRDNDMSVVTSTDRQRVEIKTFSSSPAFLLGYIGETVTYKWRFKIPVGFQPSSGFTHIHQVKPVDGDDSHPIFAITLRKGTPNKLEVAYVKDYSVSSSPTKLANIDLSLFEGKWVEVTEVIKVGTGTSGTYSMLIKYVPTPTNNISTTLFTYANNAMQTIRTAATDPGSPQVANTFIRPKWGIYRKLDDLTLKDETIRFSDISISKGTSKIDQTITFDAISTKQINQADFSANATASSGLAVTLSSSNSAVATIVNGLIHIVGVGETTITASQVGDASYNAAPDVNQSLSVVETNNFVFRSLTSGSWNTPATWQNDSGNGTWVTSSLAPTAFNSVYIQNGHAVTVSGTEAYCKDLHINAISTSSIGVVAISATNNVNVNGKLRAYTGAAITSSIDGGFTGTNTTTLFSGMITNASTGVLKFVGSTRNITNTGEWSGSGALFNSEVELDSGAVGTLQTAIKFRNVTIKSGTLTTNFTINVGSNVGIGTLTINSGAKLITSRTYSSTGTQSITYNSSSKCGAVTVNGILELTGANPVIDCTTFSGSGTVIYSGTAQSLLKFGSFTATDPGISITNYNNLILSGTGVKTFPTHDITVNNDLTVSGSASLTVPSGRNLTVNNSVINNTVATALVIESGANLKQGSASTTNTNTGAITVKRNSNPLYRLDYTLWSSPVTDQNLLNFSSLTANSRFYAYNPATNLYNSVVPSATDFATANGYLIRMPNTDPTSGYDAGTTTLSYPGIFTGVPNNGDVSLGSEEGLLSDKFYAIGNPYPSTVSANLFLSGNTTGGTLYFWRKTNAIANSGSAYASYTTLGGTAGSNIAPNNVTPNGSIQVGQGFIVKTGLSATTLNFTNAMRTTDISNQFFRTKAEVERNRIWLNLTNSSGAFSQMLLGYMTGATNDYDNGIDGKYIGDSAIALTSNINGEEYSIQGRALPFDASDVVVLNFKTNIAGDYTIGIDTVDGLFSNGQDIFLKDNTTGIETDLKASNYNFIATVGEDNSRFVLKYQKTLSTNEATFDVNSIKVYKKNNLWNVDSGSIDMDRISVYDIHGKLVYKQTDIKSSLASIAGLSKTNGVLIFTIVSKDQIEVSIKGLN